MGGSELAVLDRPESVEGRRDFSARRRSCVGVLRQHPRDQIFERSRDTGPELTKPWRLLEQHLAENRDGTFAGEGWLPRERFEEHATECEQIGPAIDDARAAGLFGS